MGSSFTGSPFYLSPLSKRPVNSAKIVSKNPPIPKCIFGPTSRKTNPRRFSVYCSTVNQLSVVQASSVSVKVQRLDFEFKSLPQPVERVKRLLHYATLLPLFDESSRIQENRVLGCTTQVWLDVKMDGNGVVSFRADSDSEITKGFCSCLIWLLDGAEAEEVLSVKADDLVEMNVGLPSRGKSRVNTWHNVLISMQRRTKDLVEERSRNDHQALEALASLVAVNGSCKETQSAIARDHGSYMMMKNFGSAAQVMVSVYICIFYPRSLQQLRFMEFKHLSLQALLIMEILLLSDPVFCFSHCSFPAIFNFGDSNSDTGGLSAAFGQAPPPNGQTFFHAPAGRFCDGRLLIDFIAERLGLPHLSAFLDSLGSNFSHGANFATAGSTIRAQNTTIRQSGYSPISLDVQYVQYSDFLTRSQIIRKKGFFNNLLPEEDYFSQALYTFDIGQNDLTAGYKLNMSVEQVEAYVPDLLRQLSNVIKLLYTQGARSFWMHNTGPVGCLPYVMDRFPVAAARIDKYGCASPYNEVAQYFNIRLKETVLQLRKELPLAAITYVDVYSVKYSLISQAKKLGFENPFLVCCGHGGRYNYNRFDKCGSKKIINGTVTVLSKSCRDRSVRINWDGTHFTEAANRWIFDQIVDGSFSDPPVSLQLACNRMSS